MPEDSTSPLASLDAFSEQMNSPRALHAVLQNYLAARKSDPEGRFTAGAEFVAFADRWMHGVSPVERQERMQRLLMDVPDQEQTVVANHCALVGSSDPLVRAAGRLLRPDAGLAEIAHAATILTAANSRDRIQQEEEDLASNLINTLLVIRYHSMAGEKFHMEDAVTLFRSWLPGVADSASWFFKGEFQAVSA